MSALNVGELHLQDQWSRLSVWTNNAVFLDRTLSLLLSDRHLQPCYSTIINTVTGKAVASCTLCVCERERERERERESGLVKAFG